MECRRISFRITKGYKGDSLPFHPITRLLLFSNHGRQRLYPSLSLKWVEIVVEGGLKKFASLLQRSAEDEEIF